MNESVTVAWLRSGDAYMWGAVQFSGLYRYEEVARAHRVHAVGWALRSLKLWRRAVDPVSISCRGVAYVADAGLPHVLHDATPGVEHMVRQFPGLMEDVAVMIGGKTEPSWKVFQPAASQHIEVEICPPLEVVPKLVWHDPGVAYRQE